MYIYYNNITYIILFAYNKIFVFNGRRSPDGLPRVRKEENHSSHFGKFVQRPM